MIGKTKKLKLNFTFRKNELKELLNNKNILKKRKQEKIYWMKRKFKEYYNLPIKGNLKKVRFRVLDKLALQLYKKGTFKMKLVDKKDIKQVIVPEPVFTLTIETEIIKSDQGLRLLMNLKE